MIGAFAKMTGRGARVLTTELAEGSDAPPERFVERIPHEGGDVVLAPILDALRAVLRRDKRADVPSTDAPQSSIPRQEATEP